MRLEEEVDIAVPGKISSSVSRVRIAISPAVPVALSRRRTSSGTCLIVCHVHHDHYLQIVLQQNLYLRR
ncbi:hypothetical protein ANAPRD1_00847 [Anaplasma phagocytophilum]|nr:hypothetical protein ANAPH2_00677 [Anaplasma phagocytophilum]SCV65444.1 hypothetical protein ANAPRD1_00847 [Anaplasma phagocytophilum]